MTRPGGRGRRRRDSEYRDALLRGAPLDGTFAPDGGAGSDIAAPTDRVADLLSAARQPATPDELTRMSTAAAAFASSGDGTDSSAPGLTRRRSLIGALATATLATKLIAGAVAATAAAGIAVAAAEYHPHRAPRPAPVTSDHSRSPGRSDSPDATPSSSSSASTSSSGTATPSRSGTATSSPTGSGTATSTTPAPSGVTTSVSGSAPPSSGAGTTGGLRSRPVQPPHS